MIISDLLDSGSKILKNKKVQSYQLDSEIMLSSLLKKKREHIIINFEKKVPQATINDFNKLIIRRSKKEPLAYILNSKEFWSKNFFVNRNTLIPRPETELLCDAVIRILKNKKSYILDVGTGTGCILLSILSEVKKARGIGIDISKRTIEVAKKNSNNLRLNKRVKFFNKSLEGIFNYKFDLVVSNPPYIKTGDIKNLSDDVRKFEPKIALDGGKDGLDVIKKVIYKSRTILKKFGLLALEIGYGQHYKVSKILKKQGFKEEKIVKDYRDNIRCILARFEN
jgi:release factor glutamine methyltransferase